MTVSIAARSPKTRPDLPRSSSHTSGFFFCGMMDEPVENSSASLINANSPPDQYTNSSLMRERWSMTSAAAERYSMTKSRSDTPSSEFSVTLSKPKSFAVSARSTGNVVATAAPLPSGITLTRLRQSFSRSASRRNILA